MSCLLWSCVIFTDFAYDINNTLGYLKILFRFISITLFSLLLFIVINRFFGKPAIKAERIISAVAVLVCLVLMTVPEGRMHIVCNYLVGAFALAIITYSFFFVIYNISESGNITATLIAFAISVIFLFSIGDLREALSVSGQKYSGMTTHYAAPFFVFALGFKLIRDFVGARARAEDLNKTLERRIEEKTQELQSNFSEMHKLQKLQILAEERDRLIMEMHDGLGGQLVAAMSMLDYEKVDKKSVSVAIKAALSDLRLMIDALDPASDDLAIVLGGFRERLEHSLNNTPFTLVWQVNDVPNTESMPPHSSLHILRILQEAITNALKYSGGNEIAVITGVHENNIFLAVEDNGKGIKHLDNIDENDGRGIKNIKRRAAEINGEIRIENTERGFRLVLLIPY